MFRIARIPRSLRSWTAISRRVAAALLLAGMFAAVTRAGQFDPIVTCTTPPTYAGLVSAANNSSATCAVTLSWAPATSNCGGGAPTYKIYRSTTPGFTPSGANLIANGVAGSPFTDAGAIVNGIPFYYIVHAVDSSLNEDANLVQRTAVPTGPAGSPVTYNSADVPKAIPDSNPAGATSVLSIANNPAIITDVNVNLNATHTYVADLAFTLIAPNAVTDALITNRGNAGQNFSGTVLDDSAITPIAAGVAPFTGAYIPESPLSAVNSIPANGTWQLKVVDNSFGDVGSITSWSLAITTANNCVSSVCTAPGGLANNSAADISACSSGIIVSWTAPAAWGDTIGNRGWTVLRDGSPIAAGPCFGTLPGTTLSCMDTPGNALAHTYSVRVTNGCGLTATTAGASASDLNNSPAVPVQSAALSGNQQVTVNWALASGATGYQVKRGASGGPYSNVGPLQSGATVSYLDTGLTNGTQYCYVVVSSNGCATSANSNEQCATPLACVDTAKLSDAMESGTGNWTLGGGGFAWINSTAAANSPTHSLLGADPNTSPARNKCGFAQLAAAPIALGAGANFAQLSFWSQSALAADDNGIVEISINGGTSWAKLNTVNYPATVTTIGSAACLAVNPAVSDPAFAGTHAGANYSGSLNAFRGQSVLIRFSLVTGSTASSGSNWFVDDIRIDEYNGLATTMNPVKQVKSGVDLVENWNTAVGVNNFNVYRATSSHPASWGAAIATPGANATSYTDAGQLSAAGSQFYTVTTVNNCAESAQ